MINGQAIAIEMVMSLLAARVGAHVPIACCGSNRDKSRFWLLQCDYERTLDECMSQRWCELHSKYIQSDGGLDPDKIELTVLTHAIRMVRLLSRMGMLLLRLDPCRNIAASVSNTLPLKAVVAMTDMRTDQCQFVDLGDEFCQWYMEAFCWSDSRSVAQRRQTPARQRA